MKKLIQIAMVLIIGLILSACGSDGGVKSGDGTAGPGGAKSTAMPGGGDWKGHPLDNPAGPMATRTIYFDFDMSDVRPESQSVLAAHGSYLAANPGTSVTLEGHADERGSREYNIGLGERRAHAVRRLILVQGASDSQIQTVSYGEERPVSLGHDDNAWSRNRRVEIVYKR